MKKKAHPRLVLWSLIAALLVVVIWVGINGERKGTGPELSASEDKVLSDFREMHTIEVPVDPVLGGRFYAVELLFPKNYSGRQGDILWARVEDGHIGATVEYRIQSLEAGPPLKINYQPIKVYAPDYKPDTDFDIRPLDGGQLQQH